MISILNIKLIEMILTKIRKKGAKFLILLLLLFYFLHFLIFTFYVYKAKANEYYWLCVTESNNKKTMYANSVYPLLTVADLQWKTLLLFFRIY